MYELLRKLARDDMAIIFISSELEELALIADRVLAIYEGRIAGELADSDLTVDRIGELIVDPPAPELRP